FASSQDFTQNAEGIAHALFIGVFSRRKPALLKAWNADTIVLQRNSPFGLNRRLLRPVTRWQGWTRLHLAIGFLGQPSDGFAINVTGNDENCIVRCVVTVIEVGQLFPCKRFDL